MSLSGGITGREDLRTGGLVEFESWRTVDSRSDEVCSGTAAAAGATLSIHYFEPELEVSEFTTSLFVLGLNT